MATRWSPDTCDCQIEYDLDGETFINVKTVRTCKMHAGLIDDAHMVPVVERNRLKNDVWREFFDQGSDPKLLDVQYDPDDDQQLLIKNHGFDVAKKNIIKSVLDGKFAGKKIKMV